MSETTERTGPALAWFPLQLLLIAVMAPLALAALAGDPVASGFSNELSPALGLDRLSGAFLLLVCLLGLASALGGRAGKAGFGWLGLLFLAAMALFLAARDVLTFLAAWELMSLAPAAAILFQGQEQRARRAVLIYIGTTHICSAGVWLGMLYLQDHGLLAGEGAEVPLLIAIALVVGLAAKAGLAPLQFWLPRAHPLAPAPVSALMSGAMIAMPVYAMIRLLFAWIEAPAGIGWGILVAGLASALIGAYGAARSGEVKQLLAFSSVENIGLAAVALGLAVILAAGGEQGPAALALALALFQLLAHGLAKSSLFLASGLMSAQLGSLELERLGGLIGRMPVTSVAVILSAFSLAAIPPLAGFAAEWGLLQTLLSGSSQQQGWAALALIAAAGLIALVAGLVVLAFCKLLGLALLGSPRSRAAEQVREPGLGGLSASLIGALGVVLLGLASGFVLPGIESQLAAPLAGGTAGKGAGIALDLPGSGTLSLFAVAGAMLIAGAVIWRLRGPGRSAPADTWICGQPQSPRLAWTAAGFARTLTLSVTLPARWSLHRPLLAGMLAAASQMRRLQSGRLRGYLAYLAVAVVLALSSARLGLLG